MAEKFFINLDGLAAFKTGLAGLFAKKSETVAKAGDTMTGMLKAPAVSGLPGAGDQLSLMASDKAGELGAYVSLCKATHDGHPGGWAIAARDPENTDYVSALFGFPDGRLVMNQNTVTGGAKSYNLVKSVNGTPAGSDGNVSLSVSAVPVGTICYFANGTAPAGFLVCNGAAVSSATYAALYAVIGGTFGEKIGVYGDHSFNLPNLIGRFPQGSTTVGTVKSAGLPNITAKFVGGKNDCGCDDAYKTGSGAVARDSVVAAYQGSNGPNMSVFSFDASRSNGIYGKSTTVQPPALTLLPMIKY